MFISNAYAQATTVQTADPMMASLLAWGPLILVFLVFYFLVLRPQSQRAKEHTEMLKTLEKGDVILTAGGFRATIAKVNEEDNLLTLELAEGTMAMLETASVARVLERQADKKPSKTEKRKLPITKKKK